MTHGHELRGQGMLKGIGAPGGERERGEKIWDNCNSIINKIYFKKRKIFFRAQYACQVSHN